MKKIYPCSIYYLYHSIELTNNIYQTLRENEQLEQYLNVKQCSIYDSCIEIMKFMDNVLYIDKCRSVSSMTVFDECIVKEGVNNE